MALTELDLNRDVANSQVETKSAWEITSLSSAQNSNAVAYTPLATTTAFYMNAQGTTTTTPLSSTFRHISNFFFSNTAGNVIPIAQDQTSTTSMARVIQLGRTTMDDGIVSGSVTAVFSFGTSGNNSYIDLPETSLTGSIGRKGSLVSQGNTANIVGSVYYDWGTLIFHGGTGFPHFLIDSSSGFYFGAASADKVVCTQLSFKSLNITKRTAFFCRAFNKEFNYTNNPTAIADTTLGTITASLTANPTTYITTVGLYSDDGELLAVAKVSPPVKKKFDTETTFSTNINY